MRTPSRRYPSQPEFEFEIDPEPAQEELTSWGGIPLLIRAFRSLRLPESIRRRLRLRRRERGFDEVSMVESFLVLNAVGGECLDDFQPLGDDAGLAELAGHKFPSPAAARSFLNQFHDEGKIEEAKAQLPLDKLAYIPQQSAALAALGEVNRDLLTEFGQRAPNERIATVDMDATIIESHKREARMTYEGVPGYQPMISVWAETMMVLGDEFRDGNVPAMMAPLPAAKAAFAALPKSVGEFYFRGDSACHEHELLSWLGDENRADGPRGKIGFAISARMSEALAAAVRGVAEVDWKPYGKTDPEVTRECAEVDFVPGERIEKKGLQPLRYVAVRVRKRQGELFADGSRVKHFAVISNRWDLTPERLLEWHREKAGTIESIHNVLKNDLAAGVMPSKYFGANAAWLRLAVLTLNLLTALKRLALPPEFVTARPKRLRFLFFNTAGRIVRHARSMLLRVAMNVIGKAAWIEAFRLLPVGT